MKPGAKGFLIFGIIISSIFVSQFISDMMMVYRGNKNIFWTHREMMLSLDQAQKQCEVYLLRELMSCYIDEGVLYLKDGQGNYQKVISQDIGIRLNNWRKHKNLLLQKTVFSAFFSGVGLCLLLIGLYQQFKNKT